VNTQQIEPEQQLAIANNSAIRRKQALGVTLSTLRARLDPRLIAADMARRAASAALLSVAAPGLTRKQRGRAAITGTVAIASAFALRRWAGTRTVKPVDRKL
jgi:hypothetical protein